MSSFGTELEVDVGLLEASIASPFCSRLVGDPPPCAPWAASAGGVAVSESLVPGALPLRPIFEQELQHRGWHRPGARPAAPSACVL